MVQELAETSSSALQDRSTCQNFPNGNYHLRLTRIIVSWGLYWGPLSWETTISLAMYRVIKDSGDPSSGL